MSIILNSDLFNDIKLTSTEYNILKSLELFYTDKHNIDIIYSITQTISNMSIRLIDYFITKYSKFNKICYKIKENNVEYTINIHISYKQQLKCYQKKYFDPFSRGQRIPYILGDYCIITTVGQLNFFKWFISRNVYNYIIANKDKIEKDMNNRTKNSKHKYNQNNTFSITTINNSNNNSNNNSTNNPNNNLLNNSSNRSLKNITKNNVNKNTFKNNLNNIKNNYTKTIKSNKDTNIKNNNNINLNNTNTKNINKTNIINTDTFLVSFI